MPETTDLKKADLTKTEAESRSRLLTVESYDVQLDLGGLADGTAFGSRTTIAFRCAEPGATSWVDLIADDVRSVRLNGVVLDPADVVTEAKVTLPGLRAENELVIESTHRTSVRNHGLTRSVDATDGAVYAWTHFEPHHARTVFACFEQPDLKAEFRFTARVPADWTCVSNGRPESFDLDGDCRIWRFAATPRLPTYVTALCAGPFHRVETERNGRTFGVCSRRSLSDALDRQASSVLDVAARAVAYFGEAFGVEYPAGKLDQVYLPDFPSAMENFGCITYADSALFRDEPTPAQLQRRGQVQLHEIGHMWFGDLVTMPWWDGLWLKEAFATMAASLATPTVLGDVDSWASFAIGSEPQVYAADQSPVSHPVQVPVPDIGAAESIFDAITYGKGLAVLRQLVAVVGEDTFLAGMRSYFARYAGGNAELTDLLRELETAAGRDLGAWARGWVHRQGPDTLVLHAENRGSATQRLRVEARDPESCLPHRVAIGQYRPGPDGHFRRIARAEIDVTGTAAVPPLETATAEDLLLLNDDDLTYAKVRLDDASLGALLRGGHTLPTSLSRAVGLSIVTDMLADGELSCERALRVVVAALRDERDASMTSTLLTLARNLVRIYAPADRAIGLERGIAEACIEALGADATDAQRRPTLALGAASCAATTGQHSAVDELLDDDSLVNGALRWSALSRKVATGVADDSAIESERRRDSDPDAGTRALLVRAARGSIDAKREALRELFDDAAVPVTQLGTFGDAVWQRHQDDVLRPYAREFIDRLEDFQRARGPWTTGRIITFAFPAAGIDGSLLDHADALADDPGTAPQVAKNLRGRTHLLRKALVSRQTG